MFTSGAVQMSRDAEAQVLFIGMGAGFMNTYTHHMYPKINVTAVEIEPKMLEIATKWFGLVQDERHRVIIEDGVKFLRRAVENGHKYDAIQVDVCNLDPEFDILCPIEKFLKAEVIDHLSKLITEKVRVWLDVIMSEHSNHDSEAPPAKKMFAFRQSALSAKADQLWSQRKMAAEKKLRQEQEGKSQPVFVFGSKISERVVKEDKECTSTNGTSSTDADGESAKPKTAEELFKSAAQQDKHEEHDFIAEAKEAAEKKKEHDKPNLLEASIYLLV
ncbi:unnamed protein product [Nippostrongylus brasiliensis]|uniref:PABS domain-containing protein n=1 Tax=Nippostrongylus brasiliensis TaxID=27835 RepID=A0A0N4YVM3_NIPBR|nr:unnamed protein product [Nippostrongylus brasiliensis]